MRKRGADSRQRLQEEEEEEEEEPSRCEPLRLSIESAQNSFVRATRLIGEEP